MIVIGELLAFYVKACKGHIQLCIYVAHTIIQLGGARIFVLIFRFFDSCGNSTFKKDTVMVVVKGRYVAL